MGDPETGLTLTSPTPLCSITEKTVIPSVLAWASEADGILSSRPAGRKRSWSSKAHASERTSRHARRAQCLLICLAAAGVIPVLQNQLKLTRSRRDRSPVCEHSHAARVMSASNFSTHNSRNPWDFLPVRVSNYFQTSHQRLQITHMLLFCKATSPSRSRSTWRKMTVQLQTHAEQTRRGK